MKKECDIRFDLVEPDIHSCSVIFLSGKEEMLDLFVDKIEDRKVKARDWWIDENFNRDALFLDDRLGIIEKKDLGGNKFYIIFLKEKHSIFDKNQLF